MKLSVIVGSVNILYFRLSKRPAAILPQSRFEQTVFRCHSAPPLLRIVS